MKRRRNIVINNIQGLSEKSIPWKIINSLKNIPNGGIAEIAKNESKNIQPVKGKMFNTEVTPETSLVLNFR